MDLFDYDPHGSLLCEGHPVRTLADRFGTPLYLYSAGTLRAHFERLRAAFAELNPLICYSVKCCPNLQILRVLAACGSGFDVVSGGELYRAQAAGGDPALIVFAGVGKTEPEMEAALRARIGLLNVESGSELEQLGGVARRLGVTAQVAVRITPDVDPKTHAYTTTGTRETKFGVPMEHVPELFRRHGREAGLNLRGLHLHIGSPVHDPQAYVVSIRRALVFVLGAS